MKRRIHSLCAAFAVLLVLVPVLARAESVARTPEDAEMLERVRQSVVHLYAVGYNDAGIVKSRWTGTGFAVGIAGEDSDIFLTNWHVATGSGKYDGEHVRIWLLRDNAKFDSRKQPLTESAYECRVLSTTTGYPDVAVVQTMEPVTGYKALPLLSSRRVTDQTEVYALGFPGLKNTNYGVDSGPEDVTITAGTVKDHLMMTRAGNTFSLIHSAAIRHGNSGGPLVDSRGVVIGQNTYGFEDEIDLFCSVYIDYGMKMLDDLGIAYTAVPGPSRITVLVANTVHMPNLGDVPAAVLFVLGIGGIVLFAVYFVKALREAWAELREKFGQKRRIPPKDEA